MAPIEAAAKTAPVKVTRELRTARQVMSPIECRGFVAQWDTQTQPIDPARRNPVSPCRSHRAGAGPANSGNPDSRGLARRGRRLRLQGDPRRRGNLPVLAGDAVRPSGPLARGPARTADRERQLPRTSLRDLGLYRRAGKIPGLRRQGGGRFRRLFGLPVHLRDRALAGQRHPAGPVRHSGLSLQGRRGRHQQMPATALSRRRAAERLLRHGADDRRHRAADRQGALRGPAGQSGPPRADAVRQRHRQAFRQRRLPATPAQGGRGDRPSGGPGPAKARRTGRPADRPRHLRVLRTDRPWHHRRRQAARAL